MRLLRWGGPHVEPQVELGRPLLELSWRHACFRRLFEARKLILEAFENAVALLYLPTHVSKSVLVVPPMVALAGAEGSVAAQRLLYRPGSWASPHRMIYSP